MIWQIYRFKGEKVTEITEYRNKETAYKQVAHLTKVT